MELPKKAVIGALFEMKDGSILEVLEYFAAVKIIVQFTDKRTPPFPAHIGNLRKGKYKNPYSLSVRGMGFEGYGKYNTTVDNVASVKWRDMLTRAYSDVELLRRPSTEDVKVCEEWHNFQNFAEWFNGNYINGWELDKDIITPGNFLYSPETCCFIPREINTRFPKRYSKSSRVYWDRTKEKYQVNYRSLDGMRKTRHFKCKLCAEQFKILQTKDLLLQLAGKYKEDLSPIVFHSLVNWEGYPSLDNRDLVGVDEGRWVNQDCPYHGY